MTADFLQAFAKTRRIEGGYVDDPDDPGGETYRGISRRWHPSWPGWVIVDEYKHLAAQGASSQASADFPANLDSSTRLQALVESFYRTVFWDQCGCPYLPQAIADEVFDTAVNVSQQDAVRFLQEALNYLNRDQQLYADLVEDGRYGPNTDAAVRTLAASPAELNFLLKVMNIIQGAFYLARLRESPAKEKYARGWIGQRVKL